MDRLVEDFRILRLDRNYYKEITSSNRREISTQNYDGFDISFANHTDRVLKVKGRLGLVRTVKPKLNTYTRTMYNLEGSRPGVGVKIKSYVNVEDVAENMAELEKSKLTSALSAELLYALRCEYDVYQRKPLHQSDKIKTLCIEVLFLIPEVDLGRGYKYFPELDLTIGLFHYAEETPPVPHPNTQDQLTRGTDNHVDYFHRGGDDDEALNISVKMVERVPNTYKERYIHMLGGIYKIPIRTARKHEEEGIYVKRNYTSLGMGEDVNRNQTLYFTLDEAHSTLGVDATIEGAKLGGDAKTLAELEVLDKRRELEELKLQVVREKHAADKVVEEMKLQAMREKHELDKERHRLDVKERRTKMMLERQKTLGDIRIRINDALNKPVNNKSGPLELVTGGITNLLKSFSGLVSSVAGLAAMA